VEAAELGRLSTRWFLFVHVFVLYFCAVFFSKCVVCASVCICHLNEFVFWYFYKLSMLFVCRRIIYKKLQEAGVPVPEYAVLNRNEDGTSGMHACVYACLCFKICTVCLYVYGYI